MAVELISYFTSSSIPAQGLSPTIDAWLVDGTQVLSSQSMMEVAGGFYNYHWGLYSEGSDYCFRADAGSGQTPTGERYSYSTNETGGGGEGGGGGKSPSYLYPVARKSPWTLAQRDKLLKDMSMTKSNLKVVNKTIEVQHKEDTRIEDKHHKETIRKLDIETDKVDKLEVKIDDYHTIETENIKLVSDEIKNLNVKIGGLIEHITIVKSNLIQKANKEEISEITKQLDLTNSILTSWKSNIQGMSSIKDINEVNNNIDELMKLIAKTLPDTSLEELMKDI